MSFWAFCMAAPKYWHTFGFGSNRLLRKTPANIPYKLSLYDEYRRLTIADIDVVCTFLRKHYGDKDWYLDATESWMQAYFRNPDIIFLGLFYGKDLHATIMSVPLTQGSTFIGSNMPTPNVRVIECLCVHTQHRKKGIAGYMISAIDYETSKQAPYIHLYSRELTHIPIISTHLNAKTYGYIECKYAKATQRIKEMKYADFSNLWESNMIHWTGNKNIVASLPMNLRNGIDIWQLSDKIIVVSNTKRRSKVGNNAIWEMIWCGKIVEETLRACVVEADDIETVSAQYEGIFFTMMDCANGKWSINWRLGQSGIHAWYIYNFVVPKFGDCEIMAIREEI